jgi:beta-xylosidase
MKLRARLLSQLRLLAMGVAAASASVAVAAAPIGAATGAGPAGYTNPILHADYSDPDVIQVGGMYYMTSSSFNSSPALPLLQSRDMVHWELLGHALQRQVPRDVFAQPRHGDGVWAPCLRYHDGKFWIFFPDPDYGIYVTTATSFSGPWSEPHLLLPGKGIIDPTPLWDDDGQAYLLHAWAKSRAGISNVLTLRRMAPDASRLLDEKGSVIIDGNKLPNYTTLEGPKFYKHEGWYYVFAPAGGVATGWQSVFRSRRIEGPYEDRIVMAQGASPVNGPHQGAWVRTPRGEDWFFHFQDKRAYGRIVHLQPMRWRDGWPVIGDDIEGKGIGQPVASYRMPATGAIAATPVSPPSSDEFSQPALGLQWQWNANWRAEWSSLTARGGYMRLYAQQDEKGANNLWLAPALLLQKPPAESFTVSTVLDASALGEGARAGLLMYGMDYAWLGARRKSGKLQLALVQCKHANTGCEESDTAVAELPQAAPATVRLRLSVASGGTTTFSYSVDGKSYTAIGQPFTAAMGRWVGAQMGLFSISPGSGGGHADFDYFRVSQ